jgi:hypothetical protein
MADRPGQAPFIPIQGQLSQLHSNSERSGLSPYISSSRTSGHNSEHGEPTEPLPYTTPETNIFIRALTIPIPNDETVEPEDPEPMYRSITAPDNYMESPSDEHLPRYFTKAYGTDTGTMGFPDIYGAMYAQGLTNPVLRHACLAVASYWAGRRAGKTFTQRSAAHINFLLPELQRVIRSRTFDDGHLCAVYMLMSFALDTNRFRVMQKHGEGLVLMLRHRGYLRPTRNRRYAMSETAPELVIHVWRLALRDDTMCGFGGPRYYKMCLPAMEIEEQPYERCMTRFLDQRRSHLKAIKRELFLKDLLTHRLLHFKDQVSANRASAAYARNMALSEQSIMREGRALMRDIMAQRQKITQQYLRPTSSRQVKRFLEHRPFYTSIWESYCLFIYNSQTYINATLIIDPKLGRSEKFPERTTAAIDLCRAVAAREKHLVPQAASLCFAGLAFIGDYPRGLPPLVLCVLTTELKWVENQLAKLVRPARPCPGLYLDILLYLKEHPIAQWQTVWLEIMSTAIA